MARQRQYDDPISIPFTFDRKAKIERAAAEYNVAQADVVRDAVEAGFDAVIEGYQKQRQSE